MLRYPRRFAFLILAYVALGSAPCWAGIVLKISDVSVDRSQLPSLVLVPIVAISDEIDLKLSGFNLNFDIGGDGQVPLAVGIKLPATLPDIHRIIAQGGQVNAAGWSLVTVDANGTGLVASDLLITSNAPIGGDFPIFGDPAQLTGGAVLFNLALRLSPDVGDRVEIHLPNELDALPRMTDSNDRILDVLYLAGSITITSIPEPSSIALALGAVAMVATVSRRKPSKRIELA